MCADFNIHDTGSGNPHTHILLTMRPMDEQGKWLPKSKKEYVLDENGERIRLASGRYKTRKVDLVDWNSHDNAEVWRKAWADLANSFLEQSNRPERIDHRSYERQGIEQIPTVHIGVAASQMEKKGIVTERGELNRSIKAANRMLREIRAQIGKLKEWLSEIFKAKEALRAEPQQPKSPDLSTLLFRYLDIQKAKGRKYSQSWQQQHTADELKAISKAVNLLAEKGIFTLEELDAALSSVSDKASEIRGAMKPREARNKLSKRCIGKKSISVIYPKEVPQKRCCIFEGFFDMLAYMTLYARIPDNGVTVIEQCDFFVLNGVGEVRVLLPYLKEYDSIHCFLDNDEAGRTATKEITKAYPGISIDESYRYQSYNDLNDFLLEKK